MTPLDEHWKLFYSVCRKNIQSKQDFSTAVQLYINVSYKSHGKFLTKEQKGKQRTLLGTSEFLAYIYV